MARLAFLISAHTDPEHLRRLTESLPADADFYIHVDKKADISRFTDIIKGQNVHFTERRFDIVWGSILQVEYQMELLRQCLGCGRDYDYLVSMSGLDYPLWSNSRINGFFDNADGREFLQGICLEGLEYSKKEYVVYRPLNDRPWQFGTLKNKFRVALRKTLKALGVRKRLTFEAGGRTYKLYKGSSWWAITPRLGRHALGEWENNAALRRYFRTSFTPDETFMQTVAFNNEDFAPRCILTEGPFTTLAALTPLTFIDYSPVVQVLTEKYYGQLIESGKMFCRKTMTGRSDRLMDMIDKKRQEQET